MSSVSSRLHGGGRAERHDPVSVHEWPRLARLAISRSLLTSLLIRPRARFACPVSRKKQCVAGPLFCKMHNRKPELDPGSGQQKPDDGCSLGDPVPSRPSASNARAMEPSGQPAGHWHRGPPGDKLRRPRLRGQQNRVSSTRPQLAPVNVETGGGSVQTHVSPVQARFSASNRPLARRSRRRAELDRRTIATLRETI